MKTNDTKQTEENAPQAEGDSVQTVVSYEQSDRIAPELAPRDGSMFLADVGMEHLMPMMWGGHGKWVIAQPDASQQAEITFWFENKYVTELNGCFPFPS
jgi:hypothetical protein